MILRTHQAVSVTDSSQVALARREAAMCAEALKLGDVAAGHVALVVTELATNILKHGGGGSILFGSDDTRPRALSILAVDKGRGIANVPTAMQDGFSTAGSPGTGLGALHRAAISLELFTLATKGTVIHCVVGEDGPAPSPVVVGPRFSIAGIGVPKAGETANGDSWSAAILGETATVAIADGLGHGPVAATASAAAVRVFAGGADRPLEHLMRDAHDALRPTRGAAVGIARIERTSTRVDFLGVGNIAGSIVRDDGVRKTVSLPGIVGHEMRKLQSFTYPWDPSSVFVLHSDGISTSWSVMAYPGLIQHSPAIIAAVLYRDHCRGTDDATVVVVKAS